MTDETTTVDLRDRLAEIEERQAQIERDATGLDRESDEYRELAEQFEELSHAREQLEAAIDEWDGSEFRIRHGTYGDQARVNDLVRQEAVRAGEEDLRTKVDAYKLHTINVFVVETPPNAPDQASEYPIPAAQFLYERIDSFNRFGETELDDFLLSERLAGAAEPPSS